MEKFPYTTQKNKPLQKNFSSFSVVCKRFRSSFRNPVIFIIRCIVIKVRNVKKILIYIVLNHSVIKHFSYFVHYTVYLADVFFLPNTIINLEANSQTFFALQATKHCFAFHCSSQFNIDFYFILNYGTILLF